MGQRTTLAGAFGASPLPLVVIDRDYRVRGLNAAAERLYDTEESVWLGRPLTELFTITYMDDTTGADIVGAVAATGTWHGRVVHTLNDGAEHLVDITLVATSEGERTDELIYGFVTPVRTSGAAPASQPSGSTDARFRSLFERLPLALLIQEMDGRILDVNAAAAALYGYRRWDLIGRMAQDTAEGPDAATRERQVANLERSGWFTTIGRGRRADGSTFPQEVTVSQGVLAGRPVAYVLVRDLTERQRLDAELATLSDLARLHGSGRSTKEVAAEVLAVAGRTLLADRAGLAAFLPDDRIEWLAMDGLEEFAQALGELPPSKIDWLQHALSTGQAMLVDRRAPDHRPSMLSELGERFGMAAYAIVPVRSGRELTGALGLIWHGDPPPAAQAREVLETIGRLVGMAVGNARLRDSLEARQQALDASEARYKTLFDEAPQPILIQSLDGVVIDANHAAAALYRRPRSELIGRVVGDVASIAPDELRRQTEMLLRQRRGVFSGTGIRADGTRFPEEVDIAVASIEGHDRLLVQVRDLSAHERLHAELLQAQKMEALGQLVSGVAHELNNPLGAIIAFSQLLRMDERLPPELQRDAHLLMEEADRTRRIVQNLLDFARQRPPERRPTSLAQLLERTLELHSYEIGPGRVQVELVLDESLPHVDIDRAQIQQVLLNLMLNAIQAIRSASERGKIRIEGTLLPPEDGEGPAAAGRVQLCFSDDGPGVPESARDHLFDPFFTTKAPGEGTGLGLSVSYGIVASHGGRLWYEPRPERGSLFIMELPAAAPVPVAPIPGPTEAASAAASAAEPRRGAVILAVDDEPSIRDVLQRALGRAGHEMSTAPGGNEALGTLENLTFDLLLIDHRMPGIDGCELYEKAIELRPELRGRAVLMSGDVLNPDLRTFAEEHDLRLLAKPFDLSAVVQLVDEVLTEANAADGE